MSYPRNPKGEEICRMLMEMRPQKMIASELRVQPSLIRTQSDRLGLIRIGLTREERLWLADKRGIDRKLVP
jgi:hypothetical protein